MHGYKETCKDDCQGIVALSDIVSVTHDSNVTINKPIMVHLPLINDMDDSSCEMVIFQRNLDGDLSIYPVSDAIKCEPDGTCYTFGISSLNNR
jgi:hypothetical protein